MFAESSASDLFRKFMGNETNCSTNQMARKPMNVNKNKLYMYISDDCTGAGAYETETYNYK